MRENKKELWDNDVAFSNNGFAMRPKDPKLSASVKTEKETKEMVNHPVHYNGDSEYECIKVLKAWMSPDEYKGFLKGNTLKYLCRVGKKDNSLQELKKADWYLKKLIEEYENEI